MITPSFKAILSHYDTFELLENENGRNDRYQYAKASLDNRSFFLKHALNESTQNGLKREVRWSAFMHYVAQTFPDAKLEGVSIQAYNTPDTLILDYIDAPVVAAHKNLSEWEANIDRYAHMLVILDQAAQQWSGDGEADLQNRTRDIEEIWRRWLAENVTKVSRFDEALSLVERAIPSTQQLMQHGDLQPWQIFSKADTWIIYDGEKCGTDLLQYNDLAYGYGRLVTKLHSKKTAKELLAKFIDYSGQDIPMFIKAFQPVMIGRAVGMLADAYIDQPENDYVEEAKALLDTAIDDPYSLL